MTKRKQTNLLNTNKSIHKDGKYNVQSIKRKLKILAKEQDLTYKELEKITGLSLRIISDALNAKTNQISYFTASTLASTLKYDIEKLYSDALEASTQLETEDNIYTLYFSGYDIAMCVRLLKLLEAKNLLKDINIEVHGQQNQQNITITNKVLSSHSNGHIQRFYMEIGNQLLSIGGPLSCLESEDIRSDEILIFLPKSAYWEIRDTVFSLYQNKIIDFELNKNYIINGASRYLFTMLKKYKNNHDAHRFLINHTNQLIDNDHDYSALAECFKFFAIKRNCLPLYYQEAFNILKQLFSQCLVNENYKDAEYTLSAMSAIVQNNNCSRVDFINLSESIIDNNLNIKHQNNFNLIIYTTLNSSNFSTHLDAESKEKIQDINDSINDFVKSEYRRIYLT